MRECFGCIEDDACPIQDAHEAHKCPCSTCVVKIMCDGGCVAWDGMFDIFYKMARKKTTERNKNEQAKSVR